MGPKCTKNDEVVFCVIHFTLSAPPYCRSFRCLFYKMLRLFMFNLRWRLRSSSICSFLFSPLSPLVFWLSWNRKAYCRIQKSPKLFSSWARLILSTYASFFTTRFNSRPIPQEHLTTCVSNECYKHIPCSINFMVTPCINNIQHFNF